MSKRFWKGLIVINKYSDNGTLPTVTLTDVLAAKESRAAARDALIERHHQPVISLTVNMPGPHKTSSVITSLLYNTLDRLRQALTAAGCILLEESVQHLFTGPSALMAVTGEAAAIKALCMELEDGSRYGRLLDIDVFDGSGRQLSRASGSGQPRSCFICARPAAECVRAQVHSPQQVLSAAHRYLTAFQAEATDLWPQPVAIIGTTALQSMLMEVSCTPSPGLVDRCNSGAHKDMDFFSFLLSSSALTTAMYRLALAGWHHQGQPEQLLPILRAIGLQAEQAMFQATGGVNTQKGLLFLLGILSAATAQTIRQGAAANLIDQIVAQTAAIGTDLVEQELAILHTHRPQRQLTAGEQLYLTHGVTGIRGQLAAGLPPVTNCGLPALRSALAAGASLNDALVHTLLALMTVVDDSTIFNRHDLDMLHWVQNQAAAVCQAGGMLTEQGRAMIAKLDQTFINANISPGGSADLLACTYFLYVIEQQFPAS